MERVWPDVNQDIPTDSVKSHVLMEIMETIAMSSAEIALKLNNAIM